MVDADGVRRRRIMLVADCLRHSETLNPEDLDHYTLGELFELRWRLLNDSMQPGRA